MIGPEGAGEEDSVSHLSPPGFSHSPFRLFISFPFHPTVLASPLLGSPVGWKILGSHDVISSMASAIGRLWDLQGGTFLGELDKTVKEVLAASDGTGAIPASSSIDLFSVSLSAFSPDTPGQLRTPRSSVRSTRRSSPASTMRRVRLWLSHSRSSITLSLFYCSLLCQPLPGMSKSLFLSLSLPSWRSKTLLDL